MHVTFDSLKTFYNILLQKLKNHRGNWNQNDPTADDYIKNRPFYSSYDGKKEIVETQTVTIDEDYGYAELNHNLDNMLVAGQKYFVTFDNKEYECVAWINDDSCCIGNGDIYGGAGKGEDVPFSCDSYDGPRIYVNVLNQGTHIISISTEQEVVHKIDPKYVPIPKGIVTEDRFSEVASSNLSIVALSGDYDDLINKPVIDCVKTVNGTPPDDNGDVQVTFEFEQVQADLFESDSDSPTYVKNNIIDITWGENCFVPREKDDTYEIYDNKKFYYIGDYTLTNIEHLQFRITDIQSGNSVFEQFSDCEEYESFGAPFYVIYFFEEREFNLEPFIIGLSSNGKVLFYSNNKNHIITEIRQVENYIIGDKYISDNIARTSELEEIRALVGDTSVSDQIADVMNNISDDISGIVKYDTTQELTEEQRTQARHNIGAAEINDIYKSGLKEFCYTWDGKTDERDVIVVNKLVSVGSTGEYEDGYFYKVSDEVPDRNLIRNFSKAHATYSAGYSDQIIDYNSASHFSEIADGCYVIGNEFVYLSIVLVEQAGTYNIPGSATGNISVNVPSPGVYFPFVLTSDMLRATYLAKLELTAPYTASYKNGIYLNSNDKQFSIELTNNGALHTVDSDGNVVWDGSVTEVYIQNEEPSDAPEGSLWIDTDDEGLPNTPENAAPSIHVVDAKTSDITQVDFTEYKIGDIVLVTLS